MKICIKWRGFRLLRQRSFEWFRGDFHQVFVVPKKNHKQTFLTSKLEAEIYIKTSTFQRWVRNTGRSFFLKKSRNFQFQPLPGIITCRYNLEAPKRIALVVWESQSPSRKDWKHGKLQILFFLKRSFTCLPSFKRVGSGLHSLFLFVLFLSRVSFLTWFLA